MIWALIVGAVVGIVLMDPFGALRTEGRKEWECPPREFASLIKGELCSSQARQLDSKLQSLSKELISTTSEVADLVRKHAERVRDVEARCEWQLEAMKQLHENTFNISEDDSFRDAGLHNLVEFTNQGARASYAQDMAANVSSPCAPNDTRRQIEILHLKKLLAEYRGEFFECQRTSKKQDEELLEVRGAIQRERQDKEKAILLLEQQRNLTNILQRELQASRSALEQERQRVLRLQQKRSDFCQNLILL
eukprot:jgi/Botrbrau1/23375/Bobra.0051s0026.1